MKTPVSIGALQLRRILETSLYADDLDQKQVLDMVAEPLEITGEVERQGELLILRADPATYRRVNTN